MRTSSTLRNKRVMFYGWRLVGASAFMLTLASVCVFQGMGTFMMSLERHFGWSRTQLSGAFSLARLESAILGPFEGYLVDRLGNRRMILIGHTIMGFGFLLYSQVENLWQFYVVFIVISLGSGLGGWLPIISLINNWFIRRRSIAMAMAMSGNNIGGFLVPVLAVGLETQGFRVTTFAIGIFMLITVLPIAYYIIHDHPEDYGLVPDGDRFRISNIKSTEKLASGNPNKEEEFTASQALRTPFFWMITIVHMSSTISIAALSLHLVPKLTDMGETLTSASLIVLAYTAVALPSQLLSGYIADKLSKQLVLGVFMFLQAMSVVVIAFADNMYMAYLFAVLFGIGFGGRTPVINSIRGEYFGRKSFATIMGLTMVPNNIGMMLSPLFAAYMFDTTGSYFVPFIIFAGFNFLGAFSVIFMKKPKVS